MPNQAECGLVKHLSGAGKGLIEITEIIGGGVWKTPSLFVKVAISK